MNAVSWVLFVAVLITVSCSAGQGLQCFRCDLGFWSLCHTTKTNCSAGEQCFIGIGSAVSVVNVKMLGCLPQKDCNTTTHVEFPANKTVYQMVKTCCNEDFCNGAPNLPVSLAVLAFSLGQVLNCFL